MRSTCQQHDQRAGAAFFGARLHKGQHILFLHQPAQYLVFEHGQPTGRAQPFAGYDANAAQPLALAIRLFQVSDWNMAPLSMLSSTSLAP